MVDIADGTLAQQFGFQRGDIVLAVNGAKIAKTRDLEKVAKAGAARLAHHHPARRPADLGRVRRMTHPRAKRGAGPSLFAAAGLDNDAPRPLADKLRPQKLADVVGQDHLLGPDGALTRMLDSRLARLADLLGAARHRQDHGGAAARRTKPSLDSCRSARSSPASPT